jgi:hypothetical protein
MTDMQPMNWTLLNAYVDGELDAAAAADVAAAIARNPELAAHVAALSRLKAATAALGAVEAPSAVLSRPRVRTVLRGALAAGLAAVLLAAGVAWSILGRSQEPVWLRPAAAAHEQWLAAPASLARVAGVTGENLLREARAVGIERVPDLSEAHLRPSWVATTEDAGLYVGYIGVHGCRLGLWVGNPARGAPSEIVPLVLPRLTAYAWQADGRAYVVMARGMDDDRLDLLARTIERLTRQGAHPDDEARTALREAPLTGSACTT